MTRPKHATTRPTTRGPAELTARTDAETTAENTTTMTAENTTTTGATQTRTRELRETPATMGDVDQSHPDTNRTFGFAVYGRGVVADGGHRRKKESMEDVDHESDTEGAGRSFERGKDDGDE